MKKKDSLVVGQGIAGSLIAFMLHCHQIPFSVMDPAYAGTSSRVAAGMFTPVSGKRKTIHPIVLQQIPFAVKIYKEIEQLLGVNILHLHNIYQLHHSVKEQNELREKLANDDFAKYILTDPAITANLSQELGGCEITHSGWLDCELLISSFGQWLKKNNALTKAEFVFQDLQFSDEGMEYHGIKFTNIIFCEGYRAIKNPFFSNENIIPCKGDILTIQYDHLATDRIIKKNGIYLIHHRDNLYNAGSTYQWNNNTTEPDAASKMLIEGRLDAMLENKYTTIDHRSAIRPTTKNREVIAKQHPEHAGMFMLNGLGTKGVLQGPWWAKHLVSLLLR